MLKRFKNSKSNQSKYQKPSNLEPLDDSDIFLNTKLPVDRMEAVREQVRSVESNYRRTPYSISSYNSGLLKGFRIIVRIF